MHEADDGVRAVVGFGVVLGVAISQVLGDRLFGLAAERGLVVGDDVALVLLEVGHATTVCVVRLAEKHPLQRNLWGMTTASAGTQRTGFDAYDPTCPARLALEHVTSRWGILVLAVLRERTHCFGELRERLAGVSEKVLTETLRALERDGFVAREAFPGPTPRVVYRLTDRGEEGAALLGDLVRRIEEQMPAILAHQAQHDAE